MAQTDLTISIDENIRQEAEELFAKIGMNVSAAVNVFIRQAIRVQAMPFELKACDGHYPEEEQLTENRKD